MNYGDLKECRSCHSKNIHVVRYIISNGTSQYRYQCMDCGCVDSVSIKRSSIPDDVEVPLLNQELRDCYYDNNAKDFENYYGIIYEEYINSDEWKDKREKCFESKGRKCAICGREQGLHLHHLNYNSLGHEEENNFADIVPLCSICHEKIHAFIQVTEEKTNTLKADLRGLRNRFLFEYHEAINDTVYRYVKDLKWKSPIAIRIYLDTLYGKYHCKNGIQPYFDSEKVLNKIRGNE